MNPIQITNIMTTMENPHVHKLWLPIVIALSEQPEYVVNVGIMFVRYWSTAGYEWCEEGLLLDDDVVITPATALAMYNDFVHEGFGAEYMADIIVNNK